MLVSGEKKRARVLLADDHPVVLEDLRTLVGSEFDVVAAIHDGNELVRAVEALTPDVVVTDIAMPGLDGITAAGKILRRSPTARIVFVSVHDELEMVQRGLATGAYGYVVKGSAGYELLPAIDAALRGEYFLSELVKKHQVKIKSDQSE